MPAIQLIARYTMKPGREADVLALVDRLRDAARNEPGNLAFEVARSVENPSTLVLLERYVSPDAVDAHRATSHFQEIVLGQILPLLIERTVEQYEAASGPSATTRG